MTTPGLGKPQRPEAAFTALLRLARRVAQLWPDHRNPERVHEGKSEIAVELRRLAHMLGQGAR